MKKYFTVKSILLLVIPLFFLIIFFLQSSKISFIQDDTYISMRYAQNLAEGRGLVFNPNEKTEGFTSFLWVIILSLAYKLNLNPEQFSVIASTLSGALVIVLTYLICILTLKRFSAKEPARNQTSHFYLVSLPIFPLFTFNMAYIYWSVSGMEETFFIFLFLLSLYFLIKYFEKNRLHYSFVIFGILACLTRPEGFLLIPAMILFKFIILKKQRLRIFNRRLMIELSVFSAVLSVFILLRLLYYGYPLPNTFYAKSGFSLFHLKRGFEYLLSFLTTNIFYGSLIIIPLIISIILKAKRLLTLILSAVFFCLLIALIGGDVLPLHRLFFPVLPLIYLSFVLSFEAIVNRSFNKVFLPLVYLLFTCVACFGSYANEKSIVLEKRGYELGLVEKMKTYAAWVKQKQEETGKPLTVALSTIGAFSYYSGANVIDLAGLTDEYTAHHPKETAGITDDLPIIWKERTYNAEYVLNRDPDYIIFPAGAKPSAFPECALFVRPEFFNKYYMQLIYSDEFKMYLPVFSKRGKMLSQNSSLNCDNSYVANYINAANLFLNLTDKNQIEDADKIEFELKEMMRKCPGRKSEAQALLGSVQYRIKQFDSAEKLFKECLTVDSENSSALLYLRNIALIKKDTLSAVKYLIKLKQISPEALENFSF